MDSSVQDYNSDFIQTIRQSLLEILPIDLKRGDQLYIKTRPLPPSSFWFSPISNFVNGLFSHASNWIGRHLLVIILTLLGLLALLFLSVWGLSKLTQQDNDPSPEISTQEDYKQGAPNEAPLKDASPDSNLGASKDSDTDSLNTSFTKPLTDVSDLLQEWLKETS